MVNQPDYIPPEQVCDGLADGDTPTVQLKFVDAGHLYATWRWEHQLAEPRAWVIAFEQVAPAVLEMFAASPSPMPGESLAQALERSLTGPLTDPERESQLMAKLAAALFPARLAMELNALILAGFPVPHIRLQPSPGTAQIPWEAIQVDEGERLVHNSRLSLLPPATVRNTPDRRVSAWDPAGPVVAALDPVVPGFGPGTELGPVLPETTPELAALTERLGDRLRPNGTGYHPSGLDRDAVEAALDGASRFLYVGHVSTADHGLDARLHLGCGPGTTGRAALRGAHRPLTAADLVLGHRTDVPRPWRMPNRVAFIGCNSGDSRFVEPTGLVTAAIHCGASYVTSTRWTLPTDAGLAEFTGGTASVLPDAVLAVDAAHDTPDPVAALNDWQRAQADAWMATGDLRYSPVIWAALSTSFG